MVPKIHAKFRKRHGVPFAIEQLSGRQYRCRHCDEVFFSEKALDRHIRPLCRQEGQDPIKVSKKTPLPSSSVNVRALYTYDIMDKLQRQWLKLKGGDEYDGL